MTHGYDPSWSPWAPGGSAIPDPSGTTGPAGQYPYGFGPTGPELPYPEYDEPGSFGPAPGQPGSFGPAPGQPGSFGPAPGGPAHPTPPGRTNPLAIWSIVFAFVFAPIGAVLGHVALNQIRRGFQRGRDLALVGLTLSYTFTVLAIAGLAWALTATFTGGPMVADHSDVIAVPDPAHTEPAPALIGQDALAGVLLSLDELRNILQSPGLADTESKPDESGRSGDAKADPPECAGAVAAGLNTVYDDSANIGYVHTGYSDKSTVTMVDQVAASFATPAEAQDFVAHNVEQWRQCAGKVFTVSASNGPSLTWNLGTVVVNGNRATLKNTLTGGKTVPQYRILASKGTVVIDLSVLTRQPQSKPATIADRMLARVPD